MMIACKQADLVVESTNPNYKYTFGPADVALEVSDEHAEKILRSTLFYKTKGGKTTKKNRKEEEAAPEEDAGSEVKENE